MTTLGRPLETASVTAERLVGRPATREVVPPTPGLSARWHRHDYPGPYCRWNYHPEYEVHLICVGTGRYIVGDRIGVFGSGQLVLVGSNLPHHWISDLAPGEHIVDRDVVFQFHPQWLADCQQVLPELASLQPLLHRATRGVEFSGATAADAAHELEQIGTTTGPERLQHIFTLLHLMNVAPEGEHTLLANRWLPPLDDEDAADVVDRVLAYVFDHLTDEVRMGAAAALVGMSESGFSRYFKRISGQSFSDTVRKLRLAHACRLLEQTNKPVSVIYTEVGYTNLSNFNRQFLREHGRTPTAYRLGIGRHSGSNP